MSPANIEAKVKASSPLIGQAIAIGDGRPYNVALITLDPDVAPAFAGQQGIEDASFENLSGDDAVLAEVQQRGGRGQRVSWRAWSRSRSSRSCPWIGSRVGRSSLPTMKLKRKPIAEKYAGEIDELYNS